MCGTRSCGNWSCNWRCQIWAVLHATATLHTPKAAYALQHVRRRVLGAVGRLAHSLCVVGNGHLCQPMLRKCLVANGLVMRLQIAGAGLHEQAHKISPGGWPHAAQKPTERGGAITPGP